MIVTISNQHYILAERMFIYTLLYLLLQLTAQEWQQVKRETVISHNLDTTPLQIVTNTKTGAAEEVQLEFDPASGYRKRIILEFSAKTYVTVRDCVWRKEVGLPEKLPVVWTIFRNTKTHVMRILQNSDEVVSLDYSSSGSCKDRSEWNDGRRILEFTFKSEDNASDTYRAMPTGKLSFD